MTTRYVITILAALLVISVLAVLPHHTALAQKPTPTPMPGTNLLDDIIPPLQQRDNNQLVAAGSDYKVVPILFVPNDQAANSLALPFINKQMQLVQRWYREQLRDHTFDLETGAGGDGNISPRLLFW